MRAKEARKASWGIGGAFYSVLGVGEGVFIPSCSIQIFTLLALLSTVLVFVPRSVDLFGDASKTTMTPHQHPPSPIVPSASAKTTKAHREPKDHLEQLVRQAKRAATEAHQTLHQAQLSEQEAIQAAQIAQQVLRSLRQRSLPASVLEAIQKAAEEAAQRAAREAAYQAAQAAAAQVVRTLCQQLNPQPTQPTPDQE